MLVLVTGGSSALAQAVAAELVALGHSVRLTDRPGSTPPQGLRDPSQGVSWVECALDRDEATVELVAGVEQIVHVEPALPTERLDALPPGLGWLDACTRCVYNLLLEAADAGVGRCITLGTMDVFNGYATNIGVLPVFQPLPTCDPAVLGPHIAEFAAREFAMVSIYFTTHSPHPSPAR